MRILFFQWFAFMQKGIENALKKMNVSYDVFYYDMKDWDNDEVLVKKLTDYLNNSSTGYDCIFSVNFIPMISDVCDRLRHEKSGIEESGLNEVDGIKTVKMVQGMFRHYQRRMSANVWKAVKMVQ